MRLILASRSSNALPTVNFCIVIGKVKLPGSLDFSGKDF